MNSSLRKYPYPYKAWLSMANDPDNTTLDAWKELHGFIWEELKLPFGDSLFVKSFNQNLPDQVNLSDNPEIGMAHHHDIIHTWGDYMHSRKRGFDREDALEASAELNKLGIVPRVWIDHASFVGNMLHGTNKGAVAELADSSGHKYSNFVYTLDIARNLGIRYIWNGEVTSIVGQDRELGFRDHKKQSGGSSVKASVKSVLQQLGITLAHVQPDNRQYYSRKFEDGSELYCFRRYGTWKDADIDGLHQLIKPKAVDELLDKGGTAIVYSHLGKRHSVANKRSEHIPENTKRDLRNLKQKFEQQELMLSSVSEMLDYLVIRDHLKLDMTNGKIDFRSDGIRFEQLKLEDLKLKKFSFYNKGWNVKEICVSVDQLDVSAECIQESKDVFSIVF